MTIYNSVALYEAYWKENEQYFIGLGWELVRTEQRSCDNNVVYVRKIFTGESETCETEMDKE